ncbi:MAG: hypothetical protein M3136_07525, partial [Thermoproteota archaeon]|nr:hypothetical protein [Thermoproteota archaeon]
MSANERLSALGILAFAVGALGFLSAPMASFSPIMAQQQTTNATTPEPSPEEEAAATTEEQEPPSNETTTGETVTV